MNWIKANAPGILLALTVALAASFLGSMFPIVGSPVFGIVLGILIGNLVGRPQAAQKGIAFSSKKILQASIVFLGGGLNLAQVFRTGVDSLWIMIFTLSAAFLTAYGLGKLFKIPFKLTSLIGMGTAICGGSAIASIAPIIEAEDKDISYSISTVFLFNVVAVLVFPPLGHLMGLSSDAFGLWAGTAINDTSSVVAAGYAYGDAAGAYATIVKMTRTTMIIPISLIFAAGTAMVKRKEAKSDVKTNYSFRKVFPWFILWFLLASLLYTLGVYTEGYAILFTNVGKFLIVVALSAIGLNTDFAAMRRAGLKPVLLGLCTWAAVTITSLIVQYSSGQIG